MLGVHKRNQHRTTPFGRRAGPSIASPFWGASHYTPKASLNRAAYRGVEPVEIPSEPAFLGMMMASHKEASHASIQALQLRSAFHGGDQLPAAVAAWNL